MHEEVEEWMLKFLHYIDYIGMLVGIAFLHKSFFTYIDYAICC